MKLVKKEKIMPRYKKQETRIRGYIEPLAASARLPLGGIPMSNNRSGIGPRPATGWQSAVFTITQPLTCETCKGEGSLDTYTPCPTCHGRRIK